MLLFALMLILAEEKLPMSLLCNAASSGGCLEMIARLLEWGQWNL